MTYNFCQKCCTRFESCETCHAAELAAKDKEIMRLIKIITHLTGCARIALQEAIGGGDIDV